jgi:A/G-specific adenine glycosylase
LFFSYPADLRFLKVLNDKKIKNVGQIRSALTHWYHLNSRKLPWRASKKPYDIWVSEMMLQQTQVNTVIPYFHRFLEKFPDIQTLASADLQDVLKLWEGLGYYSRARNFHKAAKIVAVDYSGKIPDDRDCFLALPGVGDYIAAAVLSIAFDRPLAVVDGNVKRVLARLFEIDAPINVSASYKIFQALADELLDVNDPATFNQAVMELGALVCKPTKPDCGICPLSKLCLALKNRHVDILPVKKKKSPVPHYFMAVGVIFKGDKVLIVRRPEEKMLGGLWEFPGGRLLPKEKAEHACTRIAAEKVNLSVVIESKLTRIQHAYTHFKITADIFICTLVSGRVRRNGPTDHQWVALNALARYPFPGSNHKFISKLIKERMQ